MKRILLILALVLSITTSHAQHNTQGSREDEPIVFDFDTNNRVSFGIGISSTRKVSSSTVVFNIKGFYFDISNNTEGNYKSYLGIDQYAGYDTSCWHVGYTIPIAYGFAITPLAGKLRWEKGYYDGGNWTVNDNGIVNEWVCTERYDAFDYGVQLKYDVLPGDYFGGSIYANVSKYNYGFGFEFIIYIDNLKYL
jgi:hypothetical protein